MQHSPQNLTKERPVTAPRAITASPHLIDLAVEARARAAATPPVRAPRGLSLFKHILDKRIHLRDVRHRRVSIHHLDWKDFPPKHAKTIPHAIAITARRFFTEHPLADLTVLTVLHLTVALLMKLIVLPIERLVGIDTVETEETITESIAEDVSAILEADGEATRLDDDEQPIYVMSDHTTESEQNGLAHDASEPRPANRRVGWRVPRLSFTIPTNWNRNVLGFTVIALIVMLPFGAFSQSGAFRLDVSMAKERGNAAIAMLKAAEKSARSLDWIGAGAALAAASDDFEAARASLGAIGSIMNAAAGALPIETRLTSAAPLLLAGQEASRGGAELASGLAGLDGAVSPLAKLRLARAAVDSALPHFDVARDAISHVSPDIAPEEYRDDIELAKRELPRLASSLRMASESAATLESLLGADGAKRYLIAFQNNAELRATGGFLGSFALIDIKDGELRSMEIPGGGSYDLQGSQSLRLNAPQPLRLINPRWEFQDSNWYPDFPTSAELMTRFYEKSGGPSVDGLIAINATFVEKILAVTGPIEMPEYGKTIDERNFFFETQKQVELDYDKAENKPKQFLADLAPRIIERLQTADRQQLMALISLLQTGLHEKDLQIWTDDASTQDRLHDLGWDGAMRADDGDFLAVIHSNIAGQKTDLAMHETIRHSPKIMADGETVVTLSLERTHTGQPGALFSGVRNVDFIRVYVPRGAELIEARGFNAPDPKLFSMSDPTNEEEAAIAAEERTLRIDHQSGTRISDENGFTVFGNWIQTDPGDKSTVTLVYRLPPGTTKLETSDSAIGGAYARIMDEPSRRLRYSLKIHKQPGARMQRFISGVDLPRAFVPTSASDERSADERGRLVREEELSADTSFEIIAESQ